ncbi:MULTISPECIES: SPOR domain-containing protein [unclassified Carboxylicivirga]|uniref:SPOR domain-containing protein n=1 Tax=Carboxylicivirga TaxID=1628153 RepID=UPI003D324FCE
MKTIILLTLILVSNPALKADKLEKLRTNKKIIRMDEPRAPYYAIQIIALRKAPQVPAFFKNVEVAREYPCADGYLRFTVGDFNSHGQAKAALQQIRNLGYQQAFVVNTAEYVLRNQSDSGSSYLKGKIDPNKTYTIQLSAFRFPVYLTHFKGIDEVMEFRMKDKIFRYTTGSFKGDVAIQELQKVKDLGYKDAHLVEFDKYLPFKIE